MIVDLINRDVTPKWITSDQLVSGCVCVTQQSNRVCIVTEVVDYQYIVFLDNPDRSYKVPYFDKDEKFANLCDVKLTLEYNFNPNGNGR